MYASRGTRATLFVLAASCTGEPRRRSARTDTAIATPRASSRTPGNYLGLEYEAPPRGITALGGAVLPPSGSNVGRDFGFSYVRTPQGDMIWLESIGQSAPGGRPRRLVHAQLRIPPLARDERLFMASCDVGGALDGRIVAIAVNAPNSTRFTQIRQAWRADPLARRFDVVPVAGISCEEPGT